jgi:dynein light chain roadblock-type
MPEGPLTNKYAKNLAELAQQARYLVRDLDPSNDLTFLRVKCKKYEMMVAPDKDFFLIVVQCPEADVEAAAAAQ